MSWWVLSKSRGTAQTAGWSSAPIADQSEGSVSMNQDIAHVSARGRVLHALVSAALGMAGLMLILATFIVMQDKQDIRPVFMVTYCAFFAAAFCSPRRDSTFNWIGVISVALGGIVPGLALRVSGLAFTDDFYAALIAATVVLAALMGITVRGFVSSRRLALAGAVSGVALAAALAGALGVLPRLLDQRAYVDVDQSIAPFSVRTLDGESIGSDAWRGRVVVFSYWATWCPPCLAEIPEISALQRKYRNDPRVAVVALNAGYGGDTPQKARDFLDRRHFDIATEIDDIKTDGHSRGEGAIHMGLKAVPTLFILNKDLRLVAIHAGYDSSEHLAATLSKRIDSLAASIP
jgi:thiol-disulfide isomerase/thioredoxin